jgi:hypothetical protein
VQLIRDILKIEFSKKLKIKVGQMVEKGLLKAHAEH